MVLMDVHDGVRDHYSTEPGTQGPPLVFQSRPRSCYQHYFSLFQMREMARMWVREHDLSPYKLALETGLSSSHTHKLFAEDWRPTANVVSRIIASLPADWLASAEADFGRVLPGYQSALQLIRGWDNAKDRFQALREIDTGDDRLDAASDLGLCVTELRKVDGALRLVDTEPSRESGRVRRLASLELLYSLMTVPSSIALKDPLATVSSVRVPYLDGDLVTVAMIEFTAMWIGESLYLIWRVEEQGLPPIQRTRWITERLEQDFARTFMDPSETGVPQSINRVS